MWIFVLLVVEDDELVDQGGEHFEFLFEGIEDGKLHVFEI